MKGAHYRRSANGRPVNMSARSWSALTILRMPAMDTISTTRRRFVTGGIGGQGRGPPCVLGDDDDDTPDGLVYIPVEDLYPHPDNPRKDLGDLTELADSIKANGVLPEFDCCSRAVTGEITERPGRRATPCSSATAGSQPRSWPG